MTTVEYMFIPAFCTTKCLTEGLTRCLSLNTKTFILRRPSVRLSSNKNKYDTPSYLALCYLEATVAGL